MNFGNNRDSGRGDNFGGLPKPVKVGDEVDLTIEAVGAKGDGIAKIEGFVIFVPDCQQGETVKVRITDVRGKSAVGERIDASSTSAEEVVPTEEVATDVVEMTAEETETTASELTE